MGEFFLELGRALLGDLPYMALLYVSCITLAVASEFHGLKRVTPSAQMRRLIAQSGLPRVRVYTKSLVPLARHGGQVLARASWILGVNAIVIDGWFLGNAKERAMEFVFAHELGHHAHGHTAAGVLDLLTGRAFLRLGARRMERHEAREEDEADSYAEKMTGISRRIMEGVTLVD